MLVVTPELVEELKNPSSFKLGAQFSVPSAEQLVPPRDWHPRKVETFLQKLFQQVTT